MRTFGRKLRTFGRKLRTFGRKLRTFGRKRSLETPINKGLRLPRFLPLSIIIIIIIIISKKDGFSLNRQPFFYFYLERIRDEAKLLKIFSKIILFLLV